MSEAVTRYCREFEYRDVWYLEIQDYRSKLVYYERHEEPTTRKDLVCVDFIDPKKGLAALEKRKKEVERRSDRRFLRWTTHVEWQVYKYGTFGSGSTLTAAWNQWDRKRIAYLVARLPEN